MAKKRANGEGTIRKRKDGRWEGLYTVNHKRKSIYGKTQDIVRKKLNKIINEIENNTYMEESAVIVGDWLNIWLNDYKKNIVKQKTYESYETLTRVHLVPEFSKIQLKKLTVEHVQNFINKKIEEGLSPRTIRYMNTILHGALKQAIRNGMISKNVSEAVVLPEKEHKERKFLSVEEQNRLMECLKKEPGGFVLLFDLSTGLRRGELLALRWANYDEENGYITVKESLSRLKGADGKSHLTFNSPKTISSKRTIPLLPEMIRLLHEHRLRQDAQKKKMGVRWIENDLIFCTDLGTPIDPGNLRRRLDKICEKAGVGGVNIHSLRHAFATRALENGIPMKVVSDILGHSSIVMTADVYSHVSIKTMENEIQKLNCVF